MKDIFDNLRQQLTAFKARCNELLKGLPPIEQVEASSDLAWGIRSVQSTLKYQEEQCVAIEGKLSEYETQLKAKLEADVESGVQARLSSGEYMTKTDATAAANSASDLRETTVRNEIKLIADRRKELSTPVDEKTPAILSREAADLLPDDMLKGDNYKTDAAKVAERFKSLNEMGIKTGGIVTSAARLSTDEAGEVTFRDQLSAIDQVVKSTQKSNPAPAPFAGGKGENTGKRIFV